MAWPHCGNFEYFDKKIGLYNVDKENVLNMFTFQLKFLWGTLICQQYVDGAWEGLMKYWSLLKTPLHGQDSLALFKSLARLVDPYFLGLQQCKGREWRVGSAKNWNQVDLKNLGPMRKSANHHDTWSSPLFPEIVTPSSLQETRQMESWWPITLVKDLVGILSRHSRFWFEQRVKSMYVYWIKVSKIKSENKQIYLLLLCSSLALSFFALPQEPENSLLPVCSTRRWFSFTRSGRATNNCLVYCLYFYVFVDWLPYKYLKVK